jgi:hypothetical protein
LTLTLALPSETMNLKLRLLANDQEQSWTLKPAREYTIGTSPSFDIELTDISIDVNLKFVYDTYSQAWYVSDLSNRGNLTIDGQPLQSHEIRANAKIGIERGVSIDLIPEGSSTSTNGHAAAGRGGTATYGGSTSTVERTQQASSSRQKSASEGGKSNKKLRRLTWPQYVHECVQVQGANRFSLITGYRFTPWVRATGSLGFDSFDGYIIPDFQQIPGCEKSSELVASQIQTKLAEVSLDEKKYANTDCFIASLTDAHIVDSLNQSIFWGFLWPELFPIKRGGRYPQRDYRDFCVVNYNRVKTYLLIENYGSDLFVSWITRFEPKPSAMLQIVAGFIAFIMCFLAAGMKNGFLFFTPILQWMSIFVFTPQLMLFAGIVPKKANTNFISACITLPLTIIMYGFAASSNSSSGVDSTVAMLAFLMASGAIISIASSLLLILLFVFMFNPRSIPALDLVDAKKLDDTVSKQVESILEPLLKSGNYTSEQIGEILTRTSLGKIQFRR